MLLQNVPNGLLPRPRVTKLRFGMEITMYVANR